MRLINADKIEVRIPACLNGSQMKHVADCIKESLHNAPTVEAIPIEWLKEFAADYVRTSDKDSKVWIFCLVEAIGRWREEQSNEDQGSC